MTTVPGNPSIRIHAIPAYTDNYIWLIEHNSGEAVVVDPGDEKPVLEVLQEKNLTLVAIIITHRHWDHVDGIKPLLNYYPVPVYGPHSKRIPQVNHPVSEGDQLCFFSENPLTLSIIDVPGHTKEHIAYLEHSTEHCILFCGDTLFAAGCGRLFDGSHQELCRSLIKINQLPESTQIYCSHEYTLANLRFAQAVEPDNTAIENRIKIEQEKRDKQQPTLPTNLKLERETNPFLRFQQTSVTRAINQFWETTWSEQEDLFGALRRWKDKF